MCKQGTGDDAARRTAAIDALGQLLMSPTMPDSGHRRGSLGTVPGNQSYFLDRLHELRGSIQPSATSRFEQADRTGGDLNRRLTICDCVSCVNCAGERARDDLDVDRHSSRLLSNASRRSSLPNLTIPQNWAKGYIYSDGSYSSKKDCAGFGESPDPNLVDSAVPEKERLIRRRSTCRPLEMPPLYEEAQKASTASPRATDSRLVAPDRKIALFNFSLERIRSKLLNATRGSVELSTVCRSLGDYIFYMTCKVLDDENLQVFLGVCKARFDVQWPMQKRLTIALLDARGEVFSDFVFKAFNVFLQPVAAPEKMICKICPVHELSKIASSGCGDPYITMRLTVDGL